MSQFTTTDMYVAAYMRKYATEVGTTKVGGKVVYMFEFKDGQPQGDALYMQYLHDEDLQTYINNIKEVRGEVYRLMKQ